MGMPRALVAAEHTHGTLPQMCCSPVPQRNGSHDRAILNFIFKQTQTTYLKKTRIFLYNAKTISLVSIYTHVYISDRVVHIKCIYVYDDAHPYNVGAICRSFIRG